MSKGLKLGQLPDRVPVKITVMISPELKKALAENPGNRVQFSAHEHLCSFER